MSMQSTPLAVLIDDEYSKLLKMDPFPGSNYLLDFIASEIDKDFQRAIPSLENIDITTPAGTLTFPVNAEETMPEVIGQQCADYWSHTIELTGVPVNSCAETPSAIVKVVNDAQKIAPVIAAGLRGLSGSQVPVTPHYLGFCDVIINAVRTIIWTVDESGTNPVEVVCEQTYTVNVT